MNKSIIFSLSIVLAGVYGLYSNTTTDVSLAAFTIAYLHGSAVLGGNVITSLGRSMGTVVASVYAIIILQVVQGLGAELNLWIRGVATVLFQLPATYLRTYSFYGYAGTVAGFTTAILLLAKNPTIFIATQRVIDTYIGVTIYILGQLILGASFSEDEMLNIIENTVNGLEHHFLKFRQGMLSDDDESAFDDRIACLHEIQPTTNAKHDIVKYISKEPSLWRPKPFRRALLDEFLVLDHDASKTLLVMFWSLEISKQTDVALTDNDSKKNKEDAHRITFQSLRSKFPYILPSFLDELRSTEKIVINACQYMRGILETLKKWKTERLWHSHNAISFAEFISFEKDQMRKTMRSSQRKMRWSSMR